MNRLMVISLAANSKRILEYLTKLNDRFEKAEDIKRLNIIFQELAIVEREVKKVLRKTKKV